jgi:hypothetical protein
MNMAERFHAKKSAKARIAENRPSTNENKNIKSVI